MANLISWTSRGLWSATIIVLLPLLMLLGMNYWSSSRSDIAFTCDAQFAKAEGVLPKQVKLDLRISDAEAELVYGVHQDNVDLGAIRLSGTLVKWSAAELSYQLSIDSGQVLMDLSQTQVPVHLKQAVMHGRETFAQGKPIVMNFRLLELEKGRALVVFEESQALWSCEIKTRDPWPFETGR